MSVLVWSLVSRYSVQLKTYNCCFSYCFITILTVLYHYLEYLCSLYLSQEHFFQAVFFLIFMIRVLEDFFFTISLMMLMLEAQCFQRAKIMSCEYLDVFFISIRPRLIRVWCGIVISF